MRLNKYIILCALAAVAFSGCKKNDPSEHHFCNRLYVSSALYTDNLLIASDAVDETRTISVRMAMPATNDVTVTIAGRPDLAARYNMEYGDNAFALPAEYWQIPETERVIEAGALVAEGFDVLFTGIKDLDISDRYVLPVEISSVEGAPLLMTHQVVYFVVRGAAIINVVADVTKMKARFNWTGEVANTVRSMPVITVEALLYCTADSWEAGRGNALSTVFGIEGHFLLRVGDADRPRDQLQIVAPSGGNWPAPNAVQGLPVGKWVHIAYVYDTQQNRREYYMDGVLVAESDASISSNVNLTSGSGCYVGFAYDDSRWMPGMMSELRVWNIHRTAEQIASSPYKVDPQSEGLVGYWKFDEGAGNNVKDHTGNGTDLTFKACATDGAPSDITWVDVQIPSIE